MQKVLVTGATGFIGSNLVRRLVELNYKVSVLIRGGSKLDKIEDLEVNRFIGDLNDYSSLLNATKGFNLVFNLAAGLPYHRLSDKGYHLANVEGVKNIANACLKRNVDRLVHVSTVGVYGSTSEKGIDESAPLVLRDEYSKSKAMGDEIIFKAIKENNLPATIIRPTIAYGPGDTRPGFLDLFRLIKKGLFVPVGQGDNYFHTIYVENLIHGLILASAHKKALGQDFIIGDDPCPKMRDIWQTIANVEEKNLPGFNLPVPLAKALGKISDVSRKLGGPSPLNTQRVKFITENRRYNINKAKKLLGYKPKIGLKQGVERTYFWYKQHGYIQ